MKQYELRVSDKTVEASLQTRLLRVYLVQSKNYLEMACRKRGVKFTSHEYKDYFECSLAGDPEAVKAAEQDFNTRPK